MILLEEVIIIRVSNPNSGFMKQLERMIEKYECESRKVTSKKRCLTFEKIKIYPDYHQVILDEKEVTLTGKEFQILLLLAENRGQVFSKKRIYETIWQEEYMYDDKNLTAYINKIRKKIERDPKNPEFIQTVWGVGYKFMN